MAKKKIPWWLVLIILAVFILIPDPLPIIDEFIATLLAIRYITK